MLKSPIKGGQKNRKNGSSTGWPRIRGWGISQNRGPPGPQNRGPGGPKWLKMDAKWGQMTPYAHVTSVPNGSAGYSNSYDYRSYNNSCNDCRRHHNCCYGSQYSHCSRPIAMTVSAATIAARTTKMQHDQPQP